MYTHDGTERDESRTPTTLTSKRFCARLYGSTHRVSCGCFNFNCNMVLTALYLALLVRSFSLPKVSLHRCVLRSTLTYRTQMVPLPSKSTSVPTRPWSSRLIRGQGVSACETQATSLLLDVGRGLPPCLSTSMATLLCCNKLCRSYGES